jgi:methylaspartate mutase sigma subunit
MSNAHQLQSNPAPRTAPPAAATGAESQERNMNTPTVILGVIGSDCHAVGNKIIENALAREGIQVVNLGVMVSQDEFIDAAIETGARAILVSSIYGHGEIDCDGLRGRCIERGLDRILLYVGGNLVIGKREFAEVETLFKGMGYDRVFAPSVDLAAVAQLLKQDIAAQA